MKAIVKNYKHSITINDIKEELKYNPVERFEYGDFDNWVTALITNIEVHEVCEIPNKNVGKYRVTLKNTFKYIDYDGTVSIEEYVGFADYYVNDLEEDFINLDGYAMLI